MSRSMNTDLVPIAKQTYDWQGSTGKIKYYDRATKENKFLDLPFTFIVLDKLATIVGFSDADQSGFWSNDIRDITKDRLHIRTKKGLEDEGLYKELAHVLNKGAKYAQVLYIGYKEEKELIIAKLLIHGAAIGAWIDFCKGKDIYKNAVTIVGATAAKKGATNYFIPEFKVKEITEETDKKAMLLDAELQDYLKLYFVRQGQFEAAEADAGRGEKAGDGNQHEEVPTPEQVEEVATDDLSDLPF